MTLNESTHSFWCYFIFRWLHRLDELKEAKPNGRFWIKLDTKDIDQRGINGISERYIVFGMGMWIWEMESYRS